MVTTPVTRYNASYFETTLSLKLYQFSVHEPYGTKTGVMHPLTGKFFPFILSQRMLTGSGGMPVMNAQYFHGDLSC